MLKQQIPTIDFLKFCHVAEVKQLILRHQLHHSLFQLLENLRITSSSFQWKTKSLAKSILASVTPRLIGPSKFKWPTLEEIEFITWHFYEFSLLFLSKGCFNFIETILSHLSLKMKSDNFGWIDYCTNEERFFVFQSFWIWSIWISFISNKFRSLFAIILSYWMFQFYRRCVLVWSKTFHHKHSFHDLLGLKSFRMSQHDWTEWFHLLHANTVEIFTNVELSQSLRLRPSLVLPVMLR